MKKPNDRASENTETELQQQVEALKQRIADLETQLLESEQNFRTLTDSAPVGIYLDDAQGRATYINKKCAELVGIPAEEALDFNWISRLHPDDRERMVAEWQKAFQNSEEFHSEYRWVHTDGKIIWTQGEVTPILGEDGKATMFIGTLTDITARKEAEERVQSSLAEKKILLQELYHRTKNTLQVIRSMLVLQAAFMPDNEQVQKLVMDTENRIMTMALVQQKLYQSHDLSHILMQEYIQELVDLIMLSSVTTDQNISLVIEVENISLVVDTAIPCGLILNELLSNTLKYAFPDHRDGEIVIRLFRNSENNLELWFADTGVGVPPGFDPRVQSSLGLQTVLAIAEQEMQGKIQFIGDRGVTWKIEFPDTLYTERV